MTNRKDVVHDSDLELAASQKLCDLSVSERLTTFKWRLRRRHGRVHWKTDELLTHRQASTFIFLLNQTRNGTCFIIFRKFRKLKLANGTTLIRNEWALFLTSLSCAVVAIIDQMKFYRNLCQQRINMTRCFRVIETMRQIGGSLSRAFTLGNSDICRSPSNIHPCCCFQKL